MTWTLLNEIATNGTQAQLDSIFQYHFDTALAGRTGFTVSAHPNGSTRRSFSYTAPNPKKGGADSTRYYWAQWNGTSPSQITYYADATYTTVPGDLGTYGFMDSVSGGWDLAANTPYGNYRWWISDLNPRALLVTVGKRMGFYWPGFTEWALDEKGEDIWDGNANPAPVGMQWPMPYCGSGNYNGHCFGSRTSPNSSSNNYMGPLYWPGTRTAFASGYPDPSFFINPPHAYMPQGTPSTGTYVIAPGGGDDVAGYWPGAIFTGTTDTPHVGSLYQQGMVLQDTNDSKYWFAAIASNAYECLAFDMGLTEPDFS